MNRIWLTWQDHRRSRELSEAFGCRYIVIDSQGKSAFSKLLKVITTFRVIYSHKDKLIFVQNPSRVLAAVAALMKIFLGFPLIVDRHTNFRIGRPLGFNPKTWFVVACSEFSLRIADLTIVTNEYLKNLVLRKSGYSLVLPDRIPRFGGNVTDNSISKYLKRDSVDFYSVVFICTFADDEPFREVISAAGYLDDDVYIFITGKVPEGFIKEFGDIPPNVVFTGFVPTSEYESILLQANVILDFTTLEWCLVCGGYEALAAGKPFITSSTVALKEFYKDSALYSDHSPKSISNKIIFALQSQDLLKERIESRSKTLKSEWLEQFQKIECFLDQL